MKIKQFFSLCFFLLFFSNLYGNKRMEDAVLKVDGIGDFALHSISSEIVGTAYIDNTKYPDLFMVADRWYPGFSRYAYVEHNKEGVPVFEKTANIEVPFRKTKNTPMSIVQSGKKIMLFWTSKKMLHYANFNRKTSTFKHKKSIQLPKMKFQPSSILVKLLDDGSVKVFYTAKNISGSAPPGNKRAADFFPYDGAGIWRGTFSYEGIYEFSYPKLLKGTPSQPSLLSVSDKEILLNAHSLHCIEYSKNTTESINGLITGSNMGGIYFFKWNEEVLHEKLHIVDDKNNALRHPTIWATPVIYPNEKGDYVDILATGEGGAFFYKFTGVFSDEGNPIYSNPLPLKERNPILYGGSLVVPTLIDWDGDGILDLVSGNSAGNILFFKNVGTDKAPNFISGVPLKAGDELIHIQPDYGEDVQGPGESRWGYVGSNVYDWNSDGILDILINDSRGRHTVFLGKSQMNLNSGKPIYLNDLALRGTWRCRPGVGVLGSKKVYITLDDDDEIHLYYRLDDYNLKEGMKLRFKDGNTICVNHLKAGGTGRMRFEIVDWDGDGVKDLILGTNKHHTIPNTDTGIPWMNPSSEKGSTIVFLKNLGTEDNPIYDYPKQMKYKGELIKLGQHACSGTVGFIGELYNNLPNIIVGDEKGTFYLLNRKHLTWD